MAKAGAGSMRDALSLLDRLLSMGDKKLSVEDRADAGIAAGQLIFELVESIGGAELKAVLQQTDALIQNGLGVETLIASLVEHLRNLLILRLGGKYRRPGGDAGAFAADLARQAQQFEPAILAQDIAVLEELRRLLRQSQAGRALLDATLVRLTLADQFTSVAELLGRLEGSAASPATPLDLARGGPPGVQKKKSETLTPAPPAIPKAAAQPDPKADAADLSGDLESGAAEILAAQGPSVPGLLSQGNYRGLVEGIAVVQYDAAHQSLVKMLERRHGKKEAVRTP